MICPTTRPVDYSEPKRVDKPEELGGEDVCEGLVVNFGRIWQSSE